MYLFHHTYHSPIQNLAVDEFLLKEVDHGKYPQGICRLWESTDYFVVLGLSKVASQDVHLHTCKRDSIPVLRRCSGGGTVLQGPGCFNYSYILPLDYSDKLKNIQTTTHFILSMVQENIRLIVNNSEQKGISDLVVNNVKFSGNAQRRLKHSVLFHGTILYQFDLLKISTYLKEPTIQPDYRGKRSHQSFIKNIATTSDALISSFMDKASQVLSSEEILIPSELLSHYRDKQIRL